MATTIHTIHDGNLSGRKKQTLKKTQIANDKSQRKNLSKIYTLTR